MTNQTLPIKISAFHLTEVLEGCAIADVTGEGGYQAELCQELARICSNKTGGWIYLDRTGFADLEEWAGAMAMSFQDTENQSGARSFYALATQARATAAGFAA